MEKTTTNFTVGFKTDIGRAREMNQDSYAILRRNELLKQLDALLIVADGMGGGKGGDVASRIAAETLPDVAHEELSEVLSGRKLDPGGILRMGLERANNRVRNKGLEDVSLRNMGTTCVAAILNDGVLTVGNAGDSRAYLLRDGKLRQVTEDHSQVWQEVKSGKMTREEAQKSKFRNRLTKSIGLHDEVDAQIDTFEMREGDTILLCSDGLTTEVGDQDIANTLATAPTAQAACDRLTDLALRKGGSDNITVVVMRYGDFTPLGGAEIEPEPLRDEEEDATDERAEWRRSEQKSGQKPDQKYERQVMETTAFTTPYRNGSEADRDEDEDEDYDAPAPARRSRKGTEDEEEREAKRGGFATAVILTLLCLLAATGVALGIALNSRKIVLPPEKKVFIKPDSGGNPLDLRTDKNLNYFDAADIYGGTVRDDVLQLTEFENVIVATPEGRLLSLTPPDEQKKNNPKTVEDTYYRAAKLADPLLLPLPKTAKDAPTAASKNTAVIVAFDASDNRYQYDPASHNIFKWDQSGTRKHNDIGLGRLVSPTRMLIDPKGGIFLIDQHKVKYIQASESTDDIKLDNEKLRGH